MEVGRGSSWWYSGCLEVGEKAGCLRGGVGVGSEGACGRRVVG